MLRYLGGSNVLGPTKLEIGGSEHFTVEAAPEERTCACLFDVIKDGTNPAKELVQRCYSDRFVFWEFKSPSPQHECPHKHSSHSLSKSFLELYLVIGVCHPHVHSAEKRLPQK